MKEGAKHALQGRCMGDVLRVPFQGRQARRTLTRRARATKRGAPAGLMAWGRGKGEPEWTEGSRAAKGRNGIEEGRKEDKRGPGGQSARPLWRGGGRDARAVSSRMLGMGMGMGRVASGCAHKFGFGGTLSASVVTAGTSRQPHEHCCRGGGGRSIETLILPEVLPAPGCAAPQHRPLG